MKKYSFNLNSALAGSVIASYSCLRTPRGQRNQAVQQGVCKIVDTAYIVAQRGQRNHGNLLRP